MCYLLLILQLRCLFATANLRQLNGFCQMLFNAYDTNGFNLTKINYQKVKKHTNILNVLCNTTSYTYTRRIKLLGKHLTVILNILKILKPMIKKMMEDDDI